jgi:diguanylate cyclase (GGDEF)-like protein
MGVGAALAPKIRVNAMDCWPAGPLHGVCATIRRTAVNPQRLSRIAVTRLFQGADMIRLVGVLQQCTVVDLQPGDVVLQPGQLNEQLFVLLDGSLSVSITRGDEQPLAEVVCGEYVGEVSLLDRRPPSAFVCARTPAQVLAINASQLDALMAADHAVCLNLMRSQAERFRRHSEMLAKAYSTERHLKGLAETDALTGLHNRAWCNDVMRSQLQVCERAEQSATLAMLDIDHFKRVNDTYGHPGGDAVLKAVAKVLRNRLRSNDCLARFGGEEFVVLMPGSSLATAVKVLNTVRKAVQALSVTLDDGRVVQCTLSMGAAEFKAGQTLEELISLADQMLYQAKQGGRNQVQSALPSRPGTS